MNSYVHFRHVEIDKLSLSPKLFLPVDEDNMRAIMDSMEEQFDPVGAVLTVCPDDLESYQDSQNSTDIKFFVMCGQHKFVAMQNLKRQGKLDQMERFPASFVKQPLLLSDLNQKFKHVVGNEGLLFEIDGFVKKYLREGLPSKKETSILDCLGSKEDPGNQSSSNNAQQESYGEGDDTDHGNDIEEDVVNKEH